VLLKWGGLIGVALGLLIGIRSIFSDSDSHPTILDLMLPLVFWVLVGSVIGYLLDCIIRVCDRYISEPKYPGPH
jgi:hypothetical protein